MLAGTAEAPFTSVDWIFEVKWDGVRAIAYVGDDLEILTRNARDLAPGLPELRELLTLARGTVLDGELVAMTAGKPDIQRLMERLQTTRMEEFAAENPVTYVVFDLLEEDGEPLIDLPLSVRRKHLEQRARDGAHVVLSEQVVERGEDYFKAVVAAGLEGVMAKRKDSPYEPGRRTRTWLKVKQLRTCDCVIFGYTQGTGARAASFGALVLGLFSANGTPVFVGKVGTGFSDEVLSSLRKLMDAYKTDRPSLQATDFRSGEVTWLTPSIVAEILYQTLTRERRLRMPRFVRLRPDKAPEECTVDQLDTVAPRTLRTFPERIPVTGSIQSGPPADVQFHGETPSSASAGSALPRNAHSRGQTSSVPTDPSRSQGMADSGERTREPKEAPEASENHMTGEDGYRTGKNSAKQKRERNESSDVLPDGMKDVRPPSGRTRRGHSGHGLVQGSHPVEANHPESIPVPPGQTKLVPAGDEVQGEEGKKAGIPGEPLREYREKRDFSRTDEPIGENTPEYPQEGRRFVVHEHHASHLHYDFRVEYEGVLKSWAVPRGVPATPGERRLAIQTEDHPLEYASFEGTIPEGEYGAGTVSIWDEGVYELLKWKQDKVEIILHGRRMSGFYVLLRFRKAGPGEWLMIKGRD